MKKKRFHSINAWMLSRRLVQVGPPILFLTLVIYTCSAIKPIDGLLSGGIPGTPALAEQIALAARTPSPSPVRTPTPTVTATPAASATIVSAGPIALTDGSYYGTAKGFRGDVEILVTLQGGYITRVSVLSYVDDEKQFDRAKKHDHCARDQRAGFGSGCRRGRYAQQRRHPGRGCKRAGLLLHRDCIRREQALIRQTQRIPLETPVHAGVFCWKA